VMPPSMPPFNSRGEYHLHLLWGLILYTPGFIGGIALLKLKEWGRKLVVIMSLGFTLCLLYKIVTQASYFKISTGLSLISTGLSLVFYVLIIYFFTRHSVKKQFKR
ncbi:hypothetical protein KAU39_08720, partial [bacterium]|nr:hypothetical protein [bacterium]